MKNLNLVLILGALAREPELRYTPSGVAVLEMTIAGERTVTGANGQERSLPFYETVQALGKTAEAIAERRYTAGTPVMVEGQLDYTQWTSLEGVKMSAVRTRLTGTMREVQTGFAVVTDSGGGQRLQGGMSEVRVTGNLSGDAELRYTPSGDAVLGLRLAINEKYNDRQGQPQEKTHWVDVTLWRDLAEAHQHLKKGDIVYVEGAFMDENWTDRDGNKRRTKKIEATRVVTFARSTSSRPNAVRTPAREPVLAGAAGGPPATTRAQSGGLDIDQGVDDFPPEERDRPF